MLKVNQILIFFCAFFMISGVARAEKPIKVVTSFSILGDIVKNIGGDRLDVTTLVGPDGDVHAYEPTPAAARSVSEADLVVVNGLGLEGWLDRLIKASGYKGTVVVASTGVKPRKMKDGEKGGTIIIDPHAWQDLDKGMLYVDNIAHALAALDPAGATAYRTQANAYRDKLANLNTWVKAEFSTIPEQ